MSPSKTRTARRFLLAALAVMALAAPASPPDAAAGAPPRAGDVVPGAYIVMLTPGASLERVATQHFLPPQALTARYSSAFLGFTASMSAATAAALADDPRVQAVEPDRLLTVAGTQMSPPWGLDRVDQRGLPLSGTYDYDTTGAGVSTYIVDTGVRSNHVDFTGRMVAGFTAFADGRGTEDCNGHGTHVAGTAAGATSGVAKGATIVPVRVMDCEGAGMLSQIVSGIDWMAQHHTSGPAVANMSLAAPGYSAALETAINNAMADGITFVVAAGNDNKDACGYSPSHVVGAVTVGATDKTDTRASFSNYGPCLDLFAPGVSIASAGHTSDTAFTTMNGTSMAAPHVAGAAARYLQANPDAAPAEVALVLTGSATPSAVSDAGTGSPTSLLYAASDTTEKLSLAPSETTLTLERSTSRITFGQSVTLSGRLTSGGTGAPWQTVRVEHRRRGTTTWRLLGEKVTDENGSISLATTPGANADYRLRYLGDMYDASSSDTGFVGVRTRVSSALNDTSVRRGATAKLSGKVRPSHAGTSATLQRYRNGAWRKVTSKTLSGTSRYTFRLNTSNRGTYRYRVVKPGHTDHLRGISARRTLTVE